MQEFKTHNDKYISTGGSFSLGQIHITHKELVSLFGEPMRGFDKSDAEWAITFNHRVVTIYNWKNGTNYLGEEGSPIQGITCWNVGGYEQESKDMLERLIKSLLSRNPNPKGNRLEELKKELETVKKSRDWNKQRRNELAIQVETLERVIQMITNKGIQAIRGDK